MSSVVLPKVVSLVTGIEVISVVPGWTYFKYVMDNNALRYWHAYCFYFTNT